MFTNPSESATREQKSINRLSRSNANRKRRLTAPENLFVDRQEESSSTPGEIAAKERWQEIADNTATAADELVELRSRLQRLETENAKLQKYSDLFQALGNSLTVRSLLHLKRPLGIEASPSIPSTADSALSKPTGLDTPLFVNEATRLAQWLGSNEEALDLDSYSLQICCLCRRTLCFRIPSLPCMASTSLQQPLPRSEFNCSASGTFLCSPVPICDDCFLPAIISSITKDWWHNLLFDCWIRCPHPDCEDILPERYHVDLASVLSSCRDPELSLHLQLFNLATELRSAVKSLDPIPRPEAMVLAAKFHEHLEKCGRICLTSPIHAHLVPEVELFPMDAPNSSSQATIQVPIFTGLMLKPQHDSYNTCFRECSICTETFPDVTDGTLVSESLWESTVVSHFSGDWAHLVRHFPPRSSLPSCASIHPLNTCRACLSRAVQTQLETRGRLACENLVCPVPDCRHVYTHSELRIILNPEIFTLYDRHRLRLHLSGEPSFRWCLNPSCSSGQIYDVFGPSWGLLQSPQFPVITGRRATFRNKIECGECGFQMCFDHQTRWHEGMSCDEFDRVRDGGRKELETMEWIRRNTKTCTCGAVVQKRGGCWHMTCGVCGRGFCWECLAEWEGNIVLRNEVTGEREYRAEGHEEGCYFRQGQVLRPMWVMGDDDLRDALRAVGG
ncbi:hypothetical protein QBC42DRAFT_312148 [Cladorrhinum samala]|uniref:RBR-type E3 ubiquitin transferase n=1 Tax=Cladorrhinum samala TaxID=585594 RepID=A0AAV9HGP0_9PEZI|nr:hypothetical protein QBC42DRAFT_312148 [Cladorrhinum samala]